MKTIKQVFVQPVFSQFVPDVTEMQEGVIYISKEYGTASHLCLCGCKGLTVTPLGESEWRLTERNGKISLSPSISNYQFPCKSHYIITDNKANFV